MVKAEQQNGATEHQWNTFEEKIGLEVRFKTCNEFADDPQRKTIQ